ncbi:MAG: Hsp20 family protein [Magnetovibrio sp.]|nr:Hsp20 family protein [Magnetovibrio sp.]
MRTIDLTPLNRFSVGFDRMQRQLEGMAHLDESATAYPPYNIEVLSEDAYRITMAVAGFSLDDLDIVEENGRLRIAGHMERDDSQTEYLHRGIATRAFERHFELADHIKVIGAGLDNGLLHIELEREVPEALKPRKIAINSTKAIGKQAA